MKQLRITTIARVCAVLGVAMIACGSSSTDSGSAGDGGTKPTVAGAVVVDEVALYQGVKVTLVKEEAVATPNAPVIPARPAFVRVHARTSPARQKLPPLTAELRLRTPSRDDVVLVDGPRNLVALEDGVLSSTFNFDLSAAQVRQGAKISVVLRDATGADKSELRFPAEEDLSLHVETFAPTLKVKFVPIRYQADGSSRLSPLDGATLETYRKSLYKLYPVSEVDLSVRDETVSWPTVVAPDGEGWDSLLAAIIKTRSDDGAADDVYYVGIFSPAESEREYCRSGCVLGVAPAALRGEVGLRVAMVLGYPSERSHGTLAQEIAHALGRAHAPCGRPSAIDRKYPYPNASIGVWGWDVIDHHLVDPEDSYFDFMSYCDPVWVSDYTFAAIFKNMFEVQQTKHDVFLDVPPKTVQLTKDSVARTARGLAPSDPSRPVPFVRFAQAAAPQK